MKKAIIYARCSTDEKKQDVERQLSDLRRYCDQQGWEYDEVSEYGSGYKGAQPELAKVVEKIKSGQYNLLLIWSMDRFSREHPRKVDELLNKIVYDYKCQVISHSDGVNSADEMNWHIFRNMMVYAAHIYSRKLSEAVKGGIRRRKERGLYHGGRKPKEVDWDEIRALRASGLGLRTIAAKYNEKRRGESRISFQSVRRVLQKGAGSEPLVLC